MKDNEFLLEEKRKPVKKEKIGILIDSGSDVPNEIIKKRNMFVIPIKIIYGTKEYLDKIEITAQEVYDKIEQEIPTTSLPDYGTIEKQFIEMKNQGYTHIFAVSISSRLSGTNNLIRIVAQDHKEINIEVVDTKNISLGSGAVAMRIGDYIEEGYSFQSISSKVKKDIETTKVFFTLPTLKYLRHGGRIGHVSGFLGEILQLKPIISCDKEGVYHTIGKARGWANAKKEMFKLAKKYSEEIGKYFAYFVYGTLNSEVYFTIKEFEQEFFSAKNREITQLSPTLGVHVGPGLVGICIQKIN